MKEFLCRHPRGDRVERSLIAPRLQTPQVGAGVAAVLVAAVLLWVSIGHQPTVTSAEREGNAVKGAGGSRLDSKAKDVSRPRRSYFTPSGSSYRGFCELFRIPVILGLDKHESKEYSWL